MREPLTELEGQLGRARDQLLGHIREAVNVHDARILDAFRRIPRERFVPEPDRSVAYDDRALPLSDQQTISQPTMIAIMLDVLQCEPRHRVLEVGGGSGYAAALLSQLAGEVHTIEIRPALAQRAQQLLRELGIPNVRVTVGDGSAGLPAGAPFDRILVSAGAMTVPAPLVEQLAPGGRIAIPVGAQSGQTLLVGRKDERGAISWETSVHCLFVPLVDRNARRI
jgi:protein-L-isoaspartate(D-aspartate) O-methyltransferase